jgi:hypothetical protein
MTDKAPDSLAPRAPRDHSDYRWTTYKALAFIGALAEFGCVAAAARGVGMSRQSAYRLRARLGEAPFGTAWDRALADGRKARSERRAGLRKPERLPPERDIFGLGR